MRTLKTIALIALAIALVTGVAWAKFPKSQIINSDHDLRTEYPSMPPYAVCNFCHVAHKPGTTPAGPGTLLWNHTLSQVTSYGVYSSGSLHATDIADVGTDETTGSLLCLSCHDGTVAINSLYESIRNVPTDPDYMEEDHIIRDLSKQHPLNFTYDAALATADGGLLTPANWPYSVDANMEVPLFNGKMQCGTCHDPHAGPPNHVFFRQFPAEEGRPTFCLYCHL